MIQLHDVTKIYRTRSVETVALDSINLTVDKGEFISVMGPSGCGKSTLLNIVGLLDNPSKGLVTIDGKQWDKQSDKVIAQVRNRTIGFIFQSFHLINALSVTDNVEVPMLYRNVGSKERKRLVAEAIERVGLSHRAKHFPAELSGGQCQRVAIARAIVGNPQIILADEPTGNLDSRNGAEVMNILNSLNADMGATIVMVTHDENLAEKTGRTIRFFDGRQVQ
ncbi:MAG: ABC transporter ATP-binding protein [Tenuifilaceae bacterium]|jgi:putative ABC transport system ATP-binding protein|nr:ABC transporter ATP-binding protein [Tenuifilaceae bacterium]